MEAVLEIYIKSIKHKGGIDNTVSNPFVNHALAFADRLLSKARADGFASVGNVQIEIVDGWQMLSVDSQSVGYDAFIKALEIVIQQHY